MVNTTTVFGMARGRPKLHIALYSRQTTCRGRSHITVSFRSYHHCSSFVCCFDTVGKRSILDRWRLRTRPIHQTVAACFRTGLHVGQSLQNSGCADWWLHSKRTWLHHLRANTTPASSPCLARATSNTTKKIKKKYTVRICGDFVKTGACNREKKPNGCTKGWHLNIDRAKQKTEQARVACAKELEVRKAEKANEE